MYTGKVRLTCPEHTEETADCINCEGVKIEILDLEYNVIATHIPPTPCRCGDSED